MLVERPWKVEAILRLVARIVICIFLGTLVSAVLGFLNHPPPGQAATFLAGVTAAFALFAGAFVVLGRPWSLETFARNTIIVLFCSYGGLLLAWWAAWKHGSTNGEELSAIDVLIAVLACQGAALLLAGGFLREHRIGWREAFGFRLETTKALWLGMSVAFLFLPVAWALQLASGQVMQHFRIEPEEQQTVQVLRATESAANRLVLGLSAILIVPVAEEVFFRGILYPAVKRKGFPRLALWGTSLAFGVVHFNVSTFLPLTLLALSLVWLYERTNNLLAPIAAHALFNALNFATLFLVDR